MYLRFSCMLLFLLCLLFTSPPPTSAQSLPYESFITADAAIVMDGETGEILWGKNIHKQRPPASTLKIMTAMLAFEFADPNDVVTVGPNVVMPDDASSIDLKPGQQIKLEHLLYGLLLESGCDAAVAIAEHVAGSELAFVELMNERARELGALHSHFVNSHGLPAKNQYSTAHDLATIARYALHNKRLAQFVATKEVFIPWREGQTEVFKNTNKLLTLLSDADGVKTGTTEEAGYCLVASATRYGRQVITVVLNSEDRFGESATLLEYGFERLYYYPLLLAI